MQGPFTVQKATDCFGWWKEASGDRVEKYFCGENVLKKQNQNRTPWKLISCLAATLKHGCSPFRSALVIGVSWTCRYNWGSYLVEYYWLSVKIKRDRYNYTVLKILKVISTLSVFTGKILLNATFLCWEDMNLQQSVNYWRVAPCILFASKTPFQAITNFHINESFEQKRGAEKHLYWVNHVAIYTAEFLNFQPASMCKREAKRWHALQWHVIVLMSGECPMAFSPGKT